MPRDFMHNKYEKETQHFLYGVGIWLERVIAMIVIIALILSVIGLIMNLDVFINSGLKKVAIHEYLELAFNVMIGVEFLKMLCRHNLGSVIEVLLFAIARGMVIEHATPLENLLSVAAIGILFLIRKYLFVPGLDDNRNEDNHI